MNIETALTLNIHQLVLDEPVEGKSPTFDPRTDLTREDMLSMKESIDVSWKINFWDTLTSLKDFAILYPDHVTKDQVLQNTIKKLAHTTGMWYEYAAYLKVIAPESMKNYKDIESMWGTIKHSYATGEDRWLSITSKGRILFPDRVVATMQDWQPQSITKKIQNDFASMSAIHRISGMATNMSALRIVSPDAFGRITIPSYFWEYARKELSHFKHGREWKRAVDLAANLTLLAAEDIIITPTEFRVVLPSLPFEPEKKNPLPILRAF